MIKNKTTQDEIIILKFNFILFSHFLLFSGTSFLLQIISQHSFVYRNGLNINIKKLLLLSIDLTSLYNKYKCKVLQIKIIKNTESMDMANKKILL